MTISSINAVLVPIHAYKSATQPNCYWIFSERSRCSTNTHKEKDFHQNPIREQPSVDRHDHRSCQQGAGIVLLYPTTL